MIKLSLDFYKDLISEIIHSSASDITLTIYNTLGSYIPSRVEFTEFKILEMKDFKFIGETDDAIPNGFGISINDKGSIYEGDWVNGCYSGEGRLIYFDGDIYEGEFKNSRFHG